MFRRFIHLAFDSIFIDYTIEQFESIIPEESDYIIDIPFENYQIKHIRNKNQIDQIVLNNKKNKDNFLNKLSKDNIVILHCLNNNMIDIVNNADKSVKFVWIAWGGEVNNLPLLGKKIFSSYTQKTLNINTSLKSKLYMNYPAIYFLLYRLKTGEIDPNQKKIRAIRRINFAATFVKEDFDLFSSAYNSKLSWLWYCYYNIEDTIKEQSNNINYFKSNILLGNSADPRNNHIEILIKLKSLGQHINKIFCPLSYGSALNDYPNIVSKIGSNYFGDKFLPITDHLPLIEYNNIVDECGIVIMNHYVQQGVGNIITALWKGSKVYLNNQNPLFTHFKKLGMLIYSIQDDLIDENTSKFSNLKKEQIEHNRVILFQEFSKINVYSNTEKMIYKLIGSI